MRVIAGTWRQSKFSLPAVFVLLAVLVIPLLYSLVSSLFRWSIARPFLGSTFVLLGNYAEALNDSAFLQRCSTPSFSQLRLSASKWL